MSVATVAQIVAQPAGGQGGALAPTGNGDIDKYNENYIVVTRSLMSPKDVADAYGRRIARRFIGLQVTVANRNSDYHWLITDASADLSRLIDYMHMTQGCEERTRSLLSLLGGSRPNPTFTGADLTFLRGLSEKGQSQDLRNFAVRALQGTGTIAAGLLGVTTFGPAFAPGIAAFNGPLISAVQRVFPDETLNQVNRLNDAAYTANILVSKQAPRVMMVFIPVAMLLDNSEQGRFFKDPYSVYSKCTDLRLLDASVNGHPVSQIDLSPTITSIDIPANESVKFGTDNFKVTGSVLGRNLDGASLVLTGAPPGVTMATAGTPGAERIDFVISSAKPLAPLTPLTFIVTKNGSPPRVWSTTANWLPQRPTIASGGITPAFLKPGERTVVEISGSGFLPGAEVEIDNRKGLTIGDLMYESTNKLKVEIAAATDAATGPRELAVRTTGGVSGRVVLMIGDKP